MDYNEFAQKIKTKYPEYKDIDNKELAQKVIAKYPQYENQVTFDVADSKKKIDLRPSGLASTAAKYAVGVPTSTVESLVTRKPFGEVLNKNLELFKQVDETPMSKVWDNTLDIGTAFMLPQAKVLQGGKLAQLGNNAITGAYQGGLIGGAESLANEGDLSGVVPAAVGGAALNTSLPVVGNLAEKTVKLLPMTSNFIGRTIGRIQPKTLQQAIKPNSKALDLTEDEATNLLMNTTERVQQGYKNLLDKAGEQIQEAALRLPEKRVVFTSELKNKLDNIFKGSQVSNNPKLNPALNGNSDIYKKVSNWTDAGVNQEALTAPEMYDVMTNIKQNIPIDWEKPTAAARNALKQQVYGAYADRLSKLSPELKKANAEYAKLAQFENNEGVRRILNPPKKGDIDTASSALKNYNSTVTKGNTNRNIQDLENLFVKEGYEPFLNQIDDVNAAMDLLNMRATGDSKLATLATQATIPALKLARYANRKGLPQAYERLKRALPQNFVPVVYPIQRIFGQE